MPDQPCVPDIVTAYQTALPAPVRDYKIDVFGTGSDELADKVAKGLEGSENLCELDPPFCRGHLGIPRDNMPQLPKGPMKVFLDGYRARGVKVEETEEQVGKLKATQKDLLSDKVVSMARSAVDGNFPQIKKPIIVSRDNYILDGHHRWAGLLTLNPANTMKITRVDVPIEDLLKQAAATPGVTYSGLRVFNPSEEHENIYPTIKVIGKCKHAKGEHGDRWWQCPDHYIGNAEYEDRSRKGSSTVSREFVAAVKKKHPVSDLVFITPDWMRREIGMKPIDEMADEEAFSPNTAAYLPQREENPKAGLMVQSVEIPKHWDPRRAIDWVERAGLDPVKVNVTGDCYEFEMADVDEFNLWSLGVDKMEDGIRVFFGRPKRTGNPLGLMPLVELISAAATAVGAVKSVIL